MPVQSITPELRRWIIAQATAGHPPDIVLDAMKASGWDEEVALDALETTMRSHLGLADGEASPALVGEAATQPARPVPGAAIAAGASVVRAADREVRVVMTMQMPRVVVFAELLSADECDELIALARSRLARSETVATFLTEQRQVRVPPGVLQGKQDYVVRVAAVTTPGIILSIAPFRMDSLVDTSRAEALSGVLTTP